MVERLKVSSIKRSFDNRIYKSNNRDKNFIDLSFDGNGMLTKRRWIYIRNYDIVFKSNNGLGVDVLKNRME